MNRPRALVVRSGARPFLASGATDSLDVLERVSHTIEPAEPDADAFAGPANLAVFTSRAAAERVGGDERLAALLSRAAAGGAIAAVGEATAQVLRSRGLAPVMVAAGSGESVLQELPESLQGWRILLPCGDDAGEELAEALRARGARVQKAVVYRKVARPHDPGLEREILERPFKAFCATSPSAARWLFEPLGDAAAKRLRGTPAVALGPSTLRAFQSFGVESVSVAPRARFSSALQLLERLATAREGA